MRMASGVMSLFFEPLKCRLDCSKATENIGGNARNVNFFMLILYVHADKWGAGSSVLSQRCPERTDRMWPARNLAEDWTATSIFERSGHRRRAFVGLVPGS